MNNDEILSDLGDKLRGAKSAGRLVVPVSDSEQTEDGLTIRFVHIPLTVSEDDGEPATSYVPVFTSPEDLILSGLPADTRCVQPIPADLQALLGPAEWIAINPGQQMIGLRLSDLVRLWESITLDS